MEGYNRIFRLIRQGAVKNFPLNFKGGGFMGFHKNIKKRLYAIRKESQENIDKTLREIEEITNNIIKRLEEWANVSDNK